MSVWLTIPSARPAEEANPVLAKWREMGYKIALWLDSASTDDNSPKILDEWEGRTKYPGYAVAVNSLVQIVIAEHPDAEWFVIGGDDTLPDPTKRADEIAAECAEHFGVSAKQRSKDFRYDSPVKMISALADIRTLGVMQPTGHRWGDKQGPYIDRVAGSAWIGREFATRVNKGRGPLYPKFTHMFVDEWLQEFAIKLGVFWQRPDLTHLHRHWGLPSEGRKFVQADRMPKHLQKWNTASHWQMSKELLEKLRASGFEECMP